MSADLAAAVAKWGDLEYLLDSLCLRLVESTELTGAGNAEKSSRRRMSTSAGDARESSCRRVKISNLPSPFPTVC